MSASLGDLAAHLSAIAREIRQGTEALADPHGPANRAWRVSREDLDLGAEALRREAAVPPDAKRPFPPVEGHDPAQDLQAVLAGPHHPSSQELRRMLRLGEGHDRLVAVLLELALTERGHRPGHFGLRHTRSPIAPGAIRPAHAPRGRASNQCRSPFALSSAVIFSTAFSTSAGLRASVQTTLPLPNMWRSTFGSSMRYTRPGNCSGSYSTAPGPRVIATALRSSGAPRSDVATMFWTSISGFFLMGMPAASICFATRSIAVLTLSRLFAPVQTTLPLRNRRIAVFGSLIR